MNNIYSDLRQLIAIGSVRQPAQPHMPFGELVDQALDAMLSICHREGLTTYKDPKGYYGYAQIGQGSNLFGVLCHLDVVPPGTLSKWQNPPYEMVEDDIWVYGRGVQDDKGPSLIALHALLDLLKAGYELDRPVRFIFGLDEETNWECVDQYIHDEMAIPEMGFVPDGSFPLTYAEKGLWQVELIREKPDTLEFKAGVALNVVPGEVVYQNPSTELLSQLKKLDFDLIEQDAEVKVMGKDAHAAFPHDGKNALAGLLHALHLSIQTSEAARFVSEKLYDGIEGEKLFTKRSDEVSGDMTISLGLADINMDKQVLGIDIRYPVTIELDHYRKQLMERAAEYGFRVKEISQLDPLYVDRNSPLVQSLMAAYQTITGDLDSQPQISGGATFARSMKNFVAFGIYLPGSEESVHQPNERITKKDMKIAYHIFQQAFKKLVIKEKE